MWAVVCVDAAGMAGAPSAKLVAGNTSLLVTTGVNMTLLEPDSPSKLVSNGLTRPTNSILLTADDSVDIVRECSGVPDCDDVESVCCTGMSCVTPVGSVSDEAGTSELG